ncbi:2-hydroxychromene-2-carboxylate isomerase [bacterium HR37]|nr:2-hydroxychromene-2-carboxylate isomerase [bacterium HR37]
MKKVEFYYDIASPYSYLASTQVEKVCQRCGAELDWRPFLIGGVYKETGNRAPLEVPNKKAYMIVDLKDWARYYGVELNFPELFPLNSLKVMRGAIVAKEIGRIRDYTHKMFRLYWVEGEDLSKDEILRKGVEAIGMDANWFMKRIGDQDVKDKLREETSKAVSRGAFGAPTFFIGERMFWGNDRLMLVEEYLKGRL